MSTTSNLQALRDSLKPTARMPVVFLGHGSPMNALEETDVSRSWRELGQALPRPRAILVVSAHWMTQGTTLVDVSEAPMTIHDFYGFPEPLYEMQYNAPGHPELARDVVAMLADHHAEEDEFWGLDHGSWTVLKFLYPEADVPVFQLSIDMHKDLEWHLETGRMLSDLRDRGVLILGSGNIVHNLRRMQRDGQPQDFALEFDAFFEERLKLRDMWALSNREGMGAGFRMAHPTVDHYLPALTIAGAADDRDTLQFMNNTIDLGSVSMRSFIFHNEH